MNSVLALLLSVTAVFFLVFKRVDLGLSLIAGGLVLSGLAGFSLQLIMSVAWTTLVSAEALQLMTVITLIWILGKTLKESGALTRMTHYLGRVISNDRVNIVIISSMVGILSVPGGAIISAPMIEEFGERSGMSREKMAAANVLFRHIWYAAFPLYPALIFLASMADRPIISFNLLGIPVVTSTVVASYLVCFSGTKNVSETRTTATLADLKGLFVSILPLVIIIALLLISESLLIPAIAVGILAGNLVYLEFTSDRRAAFLELKERLRKSIVGGFKWSGLTVGFGIIYYKEVIQASGCVNVLSDSFTSMGLPPVLLALLLPMLLAFVLGADMGALAILTPILMHGTDAGHLLPILFLAFIGSNIGYLVSPLHLCLLVSCEHFRVGINRVYSYLFYPLGAMLLSSLVIFWAVTL